MKRRSFPQGIYWGKAYQRIIRRDLYASHLPSNTAMYSSMLQTVRFCGPGPQSRTYRSTLKSRSKSREYSTKVQTHISYFSQVRLARGAIGWFGATDFPLKPFITVPLNVSAFAILLLTVKLPSGNPASISCLFSSQNWRVTQCCR
jgi:hypothetical protein